MRDIADLLQHVWKAKYISLFDVKGAYWQIPVHPDHQWLTAFVWDGGLYEFICSPFGQKGSGNTFPRTMQQVIQPFITLLHHLWMICLCIPMTGTYI